MSELPYKKLTEHVKQPPESWPNETQYEIDQALTISIQGENQ